MNTEQTWQEKFKKDFNKLFKSSKSVDIIDWSINWITNNKELIGKEEWISVEHDKPRPYFTVLICFEKESEGMHPIISTARWTGDSFSVDGSYPILTKTITHWAKMPVPPKQHQKTINR